MNTLFIGKNFVNLPAVDSTNTFATQLLASKPAEGTVIAAHHQTAGRGQQGSTWTAEAGLNLTFSIILYPRFLTPSQIFLLNKLVATALWEALTEIAPSATAHIKWPNDLLLNAKKVAGTLIETSLEKDSIRTAVIGIGLNVNQVEFNPEVHGQATSLAVETGRRFELEEVLDKVLKRIEAGYLAIRAGKQAAIERAYLEHLFAYQEDVEVEILGKRQTVHVVGVDAVGRLAVEQGGKLYFYAVKEIRFIL